MVFVFMMAFLVHGNRKEETEKRRHFYVMATSLREKDVFSYEERGKLLKGPREYRKLITHKKISRLIQCFIPT